MTSPVKTCSIAFVLFMATCAATGADAVRPSLSVTKTDYLVAEPVSITFTWTNRSEERVEFDTFVAYQYPSIYVSIDDGEFRAFSRRNGFFAHPDEDFDQFSYPRVELAPGETFSLTTFVFDATYENSDKQLLLYRPGRYRLRATPADTTEVTLDVRAPTSEIDKRALRPWRDASNEFELAPDWAHPRFDRLKAFLDDFPDSQYGQYARLGIATQLIMHTRTMANEEASANGLAYLQPLLRDGGSTPIVEDALRLKFYATDSREEQRRILYRIEQLNPKSGFAQGLRRSGYTPIDPGLATAPDDKTRPRQEEPERPGPIPLVIDQDSLARLPPGAAKVFEKYWKAFARRDIDGAMECLSDDFVSLEGRKEGRRRFWDSMLRTVDMRQLHIRVEKAFEATSFESPPGPGGKSTRFDGDLLVVRGQGTARLADRTDVGDMTWVLRRSDEDTWTIVSEFPGPAKQPPQEPDGVRQVVDPADEPRPPAQQPSEKPDTAQRAHEGWIVVHPAQTEFDPERFKTVPVEDRSFLHEKHRRDEILRELVEKYRAEEDIEIREGGGQLFVVYRWIKDPRIEQRREEYVRATLEQMEAKYARDPRIGPYVLKDVKKQYDVTVEKVPYALLIEFHDDQRSASAQVTIAGQWDLDLADPKPADPPDPDEWRPTRIGDSRVYWRRTADGTELLWHGTWGLKFTVSGITRADDPLLKHYLERFPPPRQDAPR